MADQSRGSKGTAVVTGASSGIGEVYAERLAARGDNLVLIARRRDKLEALAGRVRLRHGVSARAIALDLADAGQREEAARTLAADGAVTMLVNNASICRNAAVVHSGWSEFEAMANLNVLATARLTLAVLPGFKARGHGTIVNVGSISGYAPTYPGFSFYIGTKAFIQNFTKGLQTELEGTGVRVHLLAPAALLFLRLAVGANFLAVKVLTAPMPAPAPAALRVVLSKARHRTAVFGTKPDVGPLTLFPRGWPEPGIP